MWGRQSHLVFSLWQATFLVGFASHLAILFITFLSPHSPVTPLHLKIPACRFDIWCGYFYLLFILHLKRVKMATLGFMFPSLEHLSISLCISTFTTTLWRHEPAENKKRFPWWHHLQKHSCTGSIFSSTWYAVQWVAFSLECSSNTEQIQLKSRNVLAHYWPWSCIIHLSFSSSSASS